MATVSSILTAAQMAELSALLPPVNTSTIGAGLPAYSKLYEFITEADGSGPKAGVDHNVWVWLKGATEVNSNSGLFADLIWDYTKIEANLRGNTTITDAQIATASNNLTRSFIERWTVGSNEIPDIASVGDIDSHAIADPLFGGNIASWSGTFLFVNLGDASFYQSAAIDKLANPYSLASGAQDLGSYDITVIAQGVQDYSTTNPNALWLAWNNYWTGTYNETVQDLARYQSTIDAAKIAANDAFRLAYGLTSAGDPHIRIGDDTFGTPNLVTNIGKSAHYAVGTDGQDTIGRAVSPNGSYLVGLPTLPGLPLNCPAS